MPNLDLKAIREAAEAASPGEWEWWTSCSWRRLSTVGGPDGNVLCPTVHQYDGHPDVICSEEDRRHIATMDPPTTIALVDEVKHFRDRAFEIAEERDALRAENERLKSESLAAARDVVERYKNEGVYCPCCGQLARRYRRKINSGMAATLVWLVANHGEAFVEVARQCPRGTLRGKDFALLRHWGLIESSGEAGEQTKSAGFWRATPNGVAFARDAMMVPRYVYIYNNIPDGMSAELVRITEALGDRFDFAELWGSMAP